MVDFYFTVRVVTINIYISVNKKGFSVCVESEIM